jgi:hypothetical protein
MLNFLVDALVCVSLRYRPPRGPFSLGNLLSGLVSHVAGFDVDVDGDTLGEASWAAAGLDVDDGGVAAGAGATDHLAHINDVDDVDASWVAVTRRRGRTSTGA